MFNNCRNPRLGYDYYVKNCKERAITLRQIKYQVKSRFVQISMAAANFLQCMKVQNKQISKNQKEPIWTTDGMAPHRYFWGLFVCWLVLHSQTWEVALQWPSQRTTVWPRKPKMSYRTMGQPDKWHLSQRIWERPSRYLYLVHFSPGLRQGWHCAQLKLLLQWI